MSPRNQVRPPLTDGVRKSMRSNKGKGTSPELVVRKALRESGYPGYRLNWKKAPGRPDICYPGRKIAIFVNGCFWHRCPVCDLPMPKHNSPYWREKFEKNVQRDRRNRSDLAEEGWEVIDIWECELKRDPDGQVSRALEALRQADERLSKKKVEEV